MVEFDTLVARCQVPRVVHRGCGIPARYPTQSCAFVALGWRLSGAKGCAQRLWYPCQVSNATLCFCCFRMEVARCRGLCPVAVVGSGSGGIGDEMSARDEVSAWRWCSWSPWAGSRGHT